MRVLVDATSLPPTRGGVARYLAGLLSGLSDAGVRVRVAVKAEDVAWLREQAPGHRFVRVPSAVSRRPVRLLWEQVGLPLLLLRTRSELLHSPHYTFPLVLASRTVVTLHDATFFSAPEDHGRLKGAFFRLWTRLARTLARSTVVPSRATAAELEVHAGRTHHPVRVAHHGVDRMLFAPPAPGDVAAFALQHGLDPSRGWLAFLGTVEPRKNLPALFRAHRRLRTERPGSTPPLLVAGGLGWDQEARTLLEAAGNTPGADLRYLGYLPLASLGAFLGGSTAVIYPSSAEGFGLPVLEAMAAGATVLTSPRLALPEVGGDAVAYAEPTEDGIHVELADLLASPDRRAQLAALGEERATLFTWAACATVHVEAYTQR
ncbi:glycosyltransferase family 4 protein [Planctomonas psychrotolerans]|uniref:glycosyltransferase family 4 protein n=1 Tax=Planctomonas psychrotolerans TaxID=2528712 RepID=UPI00123AFA45|nr:glycosyltransferase family 1 protein [Planctomonas psychrotolerans]